MHHHKRHKCNNILGSLYLIPRQIRHRWLLGVIELAGTSPQPSPWTRGGRTWKDYFPCSHFLVWFKQMYQQFFLGKVLEQGLSPFFMCIKNHLVSVYMVSNIWPATRVSKKAALQSPENVATKGGFCSWTNRGGWMGRDGGGGAVTTSYRSYNTCSVESLLWNTETFWIFN